MKKTFISTFFITIFAIMVIISGCNESTTSTGGTSVINGKITDSLTGNPVDSVLISTLPATYGVRTDASGNYTLSGLAGGNYTVIATKPGWFTKQTSVSIGEGETVTANMRMLFTNIYVFNNLTVNEFFNDNSYSAVNLYLGQVIQELNSVNKDMQMRDSLGLGQDFLFRSGDLALDAPGFQTTFTAPLMSGRSFTKAEFDTLSKIPTIGGTIDPIMDFPYDWTRYYKTNLSGMHHVYGFYLKGRYAAGAGRVYGMFYLNATSTGVSGAQFTIDVKINRNGVNSFNPNQ